MVSSLLVWTMSFYICINLSMRHIQKHSFVIICIKYPSIIYWQRIALHTSMPKYRCVEFIRWKSQCMHSYLKKWLPLSICWSRAWTTGPNMFGLSLLCTITSHEWLLKCCWGGEMLSIFSLSTQNQCSWCVVIYIPCCGSHKVVLCPAVFQVGHTLPVFHMPTRLCTCT